MRRLAPLVVAASTLSCSGPQNVAEQFVPPAPTGLVSVCFVGRGADPHVSQRLPPTGSS